MPFSIVMPALEMAQETGKLLAWLKKEGDRVSKGEPLLEIETDKAVVEVEAPAEGVLAGITAVEGAEIPVGQTIAWIVAPGEQPPTDGPLIPEVPSARAGSHGRSEKTEPAAATTAKAAAAKISPKARRLARDLGVDVSTIEGSGPDGEIVASDIQTHAAIGALGHVSIPEQTQRSSTSSGLEIPTTIGRIMAERTTHSWTTVPHFFVSRELDVTAFNEYRSRIAAEIERTHSCRITHTDLLIALLSRVLMKHPLLNASWTADGIRFHSHVNMAVAIAVEDGVVSAVIPNAQNASLAQVAQQRLELSERAANGKLRPADISDATFTISNLGMYKVDQFNAIITPPQAAILAVGAIAERVVAVDGKAVVRPTLMLTLSCDHRVVDGARAALFLSDIAAALSEPAKHLH